MLLRHQPTNKSSVLRFIKSSLVFNSHFVIVFVLVTCSTTSLGQPQVCILYNWLEFLRILDNSPRKHTPALTIRYCSIQSLSDPQLDIQTTSHFMHSSLVDQAWTIYLPKMHSPVSIGDRHAWKVPGNLYKGEYAYSFNRSWCPSLNGIRAWTVLCKEFLLLMVTQFYFPICTS